MFRKIREAVAEDIPLPQLLSRRWRSMNPTLPAGSTTSTLANDRRRLNNAREIQRLHLTPGQDSGLCSKLDAIAEDILVTPYTLQK